tara:strand:+ start:2119 stop:2379 length:261 start_codon:yes stop_codon:yes gene_type:complete
VKITLTDGDGSFIKEYKIRTEPVDSADPPLPIAEYELQIASALDQLGFIQCPECEEWVPVDQYDLGTLPEEACKRCEERGIDHEGR